MQPGDTSVTALASVAYLLAARHCDSRNYIPVVVRGVGVLTRDSRLCAKKDRGEWKFVGSYFGIESSEELGCLFNLGGEVGGEPQDVVELCGASSSDTRTR